MIVIFDRAMEGRGQVAINAFHVTTIAYSNTLNQCAISIHGTLIPELVKGSLEEVTNKLNEFTHA